VVLLTALLLLLLLAAFSAGLMYIVSTETRLGASYRETNTAYYGAEAAMEKMTVDVSSLYTVRHAPSVSEIQALGTSSYQPALPGITFPLYTFTVPSSGGMPVSQFRNVSSGPNEGLVASIIPLTLTVTAHRYWGAEVTLTRGIEVALLPVFQFGVFFDRDLSYSPGALFDLGGRVHTNTNLFLASSAAAGLIFHSKITVAGDVIRTELSNGVSNATTRNQPIYIPTAPGGCDGARPACRNLLMNEGSRVGGPTSAENSNWPNISSSTYNGMIRNIKTGARPLNLTFVALGLRPIEIIRRPPAGESPTSLMGGSRLYNVAQIRVLISEKSADLPGGAGIRLANVSPYYSGGSFGSTNTAFAEGTAWPPWPAEPGGTGRDFIAPPNTPGLDPILGACVPPRNGSSTCWPLINGYLQVDRRNADGTYSDVTAEWLNLGIARENANAILKFQKFRDLNGDGTLEASTLGLANNNPDKFYPLNLYDPREGEWRDVPFSTDAADTTCAVGGIMNLVELDVGNLRRWLTGAIGSSGTQTEYSSLNGYLLYFSDRRGQRDASGNATGSYRYEDLIDPANANGYGGSGPLTFIPPNGVLDAPEDVNENGVLDTDGAVNIGEGFGVANGNPSRRVPCGVYPWGNPNVPGSPHPPGSDPNAVDDLARKNRVSGARHALKLVNGSLGNLPTKPDGSGGFTVASENPVYVQANYNADSSGFGAGNAAAAVIADAVTVLSNNWNDLNSFKNPTRVGQGRRNATTTWYRFAVISGKTLSFPRPTWGSAEDYGTDGGLHNFLRFLENWGGQSCNYMGSLVSLYYSEYANGTFKCCLTVYSAPARNFSFDSNFLDLSKLPPGAPQFRDIVNVGSQQVYAP
jgi:hypothetical protein